MELDDFHHIVNTWYDPLYRFALSLSRNTEDALDLTQSAFARYAEKGRHVTDLQKAKSWLFTVLYRDFINQHRRNRRIIFDSEILTGAAIDEREAPAARLVDRAAALEALSQLDENVRAPLTLFYLKEFSYREIAEILNLPVGTVMSRLSRGREALRRSLLEGETSESATRREHR